MVLGADVIRHVPVDGPPGPGVWVQPGALPLPHIMLTRTLTLEDSHQRSLQRNRISDTRCKQCAIRCCMSHSALLLA